LSPWVLVVIIRVVNVLVLLVVRLVKTANIVSIVLKMAALVVFAVSQLLFKGVVVFGMGRHSLFFIIL
jgi:hypothetical protein